MRWGMGGKIEVKWLLEEDKCDGSDVDASHVLDIAAAFVTLGLHNFQMHHSLTAGAIRL